MATAEESSKSYGRAGLKVTKVLLKVCYKYLEHWFRIGWIPRKNSKKSSLTLIGNVLGYESGGFGEFSTSKLLGGKNPRNHLTCAPDFGKKILQFANKG